MKQLFSLFILALLTMTGCSGVTIQDYAETEPRFVMEQALVGDFKAYGQFIDRFGKLRRQFNVDIKGSWNGNSQELTLEEDFEYYDGETDRRVWTIKKIDENNYVATANDIDAKVDVESYGNAVRMSYIYPVETKNRTVPMRFEDWLWLQDDGMIINRTKVSKWGIHVGDLLITFVPQG